MSLVLQKIKFFCCFDRKKYNNKNFLENKNRRNNDALKGLVGIFSVQLIFVNCTGFGRNIVFEVVEMK